MARNTFCQQNDNGSLVAKARCLNMKEGEKLTRLEIFGASESLMMEQTKSINSGDSFDWAILRKQICWWFNASLTKKVTEGKNDKHVSRASYQWWASLQQRKKCQNKQKHTDAAMHRLENMPDTLRDVRHEITNFDTKKALSCKSREQRSVADDCLIV